MQVEYCADAVVFAWLRGETEPYVLLGVRGKDSDAFPGHHCVPGGGVESGELAREAAVRELEEETGLRVDAGSVDLVDVFDDPGRDPRGDVVSIAYVFDLRDQLALPAVDGADDLEAADWYPVDMVFQGKLTMAFDHRDVVERALHVAERSYDS